MGPQVYGNYEGLRGPVGRVAAVPLPLAAPAGRQRVAHADAGRDQQRAARERAAPDRRLPGLDHRGHGDQRDSFHTTRNPETSKRWTSVYTPDVVSVGEGPASFTDYFSQQDRWSRGTDEVLVRRFWRMAHRLGPRAMLHYLLLTAYYPTAAIA